MLVILQSNVSSPHYWIPRVYTWWRRGDQQCASSMVEGVMERKTFSRLETINFRRALRTLTMCSKTCLVIVSQTHNKLHALGHNQRIFFLSPKREIIPLFCFMHEIISFIVDSFVSRQMQCVYCAESKITTQEWS